jgi:hypothetical protein
MEDVEVLQARRILCEALARTVLASDVSLPGRDALWKY